MSKTISINPYNGEEVAIFKTHTKKDIGEILENSQQRFMHWRETTFTERKKLMLGVAAELRKNANEYARTITEEMGKPITQALAEVEKCAWGCEYYAENAEKQLENEIIETDAHKSYVSFESVGVVLAIMPWNYPLWQVFRFAAPALMAGNIAVLKHASNVFGSALNIEKVFKRAGFPEFCFTSLLVSSDAVEAIIENPIIKAVTLTGSGPAPSSAGRIREISIGGSQATPTAS